MDIYVLRSTTKFRGYYYIHYRLNTRERCSSSHRNRFILSVRPSRRVYWLRCRINHCITQAHTIHHVERWRSFYDRDNPFIEHKEKCVSNALQSPRRQSSLIKESHQASVVWNFNHCFAVTYKYQPSQYGVAGVKSWLQWIKFPCHRYTWFTFYVMNRRKWLINTLMRSCYNLSTGIGVLCFDKGEYLLHFVYCVKLTTLILDSTLLKNRWRFSTQVFTNRQVHRDVCEKWPVFMYFHDVWTRARLNSYKRRFKNKLIQCDIIGSCLVF